AGLSDAVRAIVHQFVVGLCFPPLEAGEEIDHVLVAFEHYHGVIAAAVDPAAAGVGPDIYAAARALARSAIGAGHSDFPSAAAQSVGRIGIRLWRPVRIVIFVAIFFVGLRNDAAGLLLKLALLQHQCVLAARPILD